MEELCILSTSPSGSRFSSSKEYIRDASKLFDQMPESYPVRVENLGDEHKDKEPDALDLFKMCHYSKQKKGYTPTVQLAITEMENLLSTPTEGEQPKSATQVVGDVLDKNTKKNQFLHNVGIQITQRRSSLQNVEIELEVEKRANDELRSIVNNQREQMDNLSQKMQESEQARIKNQEENQKKQAELEAKLQLLLAQK